MCCIDHTVCCRTHFAIHFFDFVNLTPRSGIDVTRALDSMSDPLITRQDVQGRAQVDALAPVEPKEALKVARKICHPWYRCQSLTKVAEHWGTKSQRMAILIEALESAQLQEEINRIVTVSAWPLRLMASLEIDTTAAYLVKLVEQANEEPHGLRRADALFAVVSRLENYPTLQALVAPSLIAALLQRHGNRVDRLIRFTVGTLKDTIPEMLSPLIAHHHEGKQKQLLVASLRKE